MDDDLDFDSQQPSARQMAGGGGGGGGRARAKAPRTEEQLALAHQFAEIMQQNELLAKENRCGHTNGHDSSDGRVRAV